VFQALSAETGWTERFEQSPVHEQFIARPLAAYTAPAARPPTPRRANARMAAPVLDVQPTLRPFLLADRRNLIILLATAR